MATPEVLEEIRLVKARYCRFLDTRDWDGFAALFTEDAIMDVHEDTHMAPFVGRDVLVAQVRAVVEHARSVHQVHMPEITLVDENNVDVIWAMHDRLVWEEGRSPIPGATGLTGYGHYHERYVRREGGWRIASLKLTRLLVEMDR